MTLQKKPSSQNVISEMLDETLAKANIHTTSESYSKHLAKGITASQLLITKHS